MKSAAKSGSVKQGAIIMAALGFGWLAIEIVFKPWLDKARTAMDKADPTKDQDDVVDSEARAADSPTSDDEAVTADSR